MELLRELPNGDSTFTEIPGKLKLKDDTVPRLLPGCPSYYTSTSAINVLVCPMSFDSINVLVYPMGHILLLNQTVQSSFKSESEEEHRYIIRYLQDLKS